MSKLTSAMEHFNVFELAMDYVAYVKLVWNNLIVYNEINRTVVNILTLQYTVYWWSIYIYLSICGNSHGSNCLGHS